MVREEEGNVAPFDLSLWTEISTLKVVGITSLHVRTTCRSLSRADLVVDYRGQGFVLWWFHDGCRSPQSDLVEE